MNMRTSELVDVFPITTHAFGLRPDWFNYFIPKLIHPAYLLMILLLVIAVGIMILKRFEESDLVKKLWNIPVIIVIVSFWPILVLGLKELVDVFNTFLVFEVFQIAWEGFGFPDVGSVKNFIGWSAEGLARLLPNLAYWVMYAFYLTFFFFFAVLGPLVLAKGILYDEIQAFLDLVREITVLFLWQTTVIILVAFIMPDIVSGRPFPPNPSSNYYFLSLILGIMIFFTASITRKFGNHLGSALFPQIFKWGGAMIGLTTLARFSSAGITAAGYTTPSTMWKHRFLFAEEIWNRYRDEHKIQHLEQEIYNLHEKWPTESVEDLKYHSTINSHSHGNTHDPHSLKNSYSNFNLHEHEPSSLHAKAHATSSRSHFIAHSQKAKKEIHNFDEGWKRD